MPQDIQIIGIGLDLFFWPLSPDLFIFISSREAVVVHLSIQKITPT